MAMNYLVYSIGILGFWAVGFALQMGGVGAMGTFGNDATLAREITINVAGHQLGLFGATGFFLSPGVFTSGVAAMFLFQMVFMDTAATIPTGALTERWRLPSFVAFSVVISTIIYPLFANWVWGGGWLSALGKELGLGHGHVDFAGSSVVHMTGGVMAFVGAKMVGPRAGKYGPHGEVYPIPGHNLAMVVLGTFILAFGWFGFNAGSSLAGTDLRIAIIAVNTMLASAAGAAMAYRHTKKKFGTLTSPCAATACWPGWWPSPPPAPSVSAPIAVLIGGVAGMLVVESALFIERRLRIDDPVGASSVHGVCGAWGALSVGLFANGTYGDGLNGVPGPVRGLFHGDAGQLVASVTGIVTNVIWVGSVTAITLAVLGKMVGNRVHVQDEITGLDIPELGVPGYMVDPTVFTPAASPPPVQTPLTDPFRRVVHR
jgi:Amt family ammonium transporter